MAREKWRLTRGNSLERMTGIEPALSAWEADVLPLNYIRLTRHFVRLRPVCYLRRASNVPQASERRNIRLAQVGAHEPDTIALWLAATPGTSSQPWCARSGVEAASPRDARWTWWIRDALHGSQSNLTCSDQVASETCPCQNHCCVKPGVSADPPNPLGS